MLTRFHKILIALLAAQLVLAVIVLTRGDDTAAQKDHPLFAGFDAAKVTRLQVASRGDADARPGQAPDARPIDLVKRDASWVVASSFDYPADAAKIADALAPIAKLTAGPPIATQASRHKQLHVADTDFDRKLVISAGGKDVTLFVGGPAGARRTAVRLAGSDEVFAAAGLSAQAFGAEPRQWVDPGYVKLAADDVARVVIQRAGSDGTHAIELVRAAVPAGSGSAAGSDAGSASATPAERWTATIDGAPIALAKDETLDAAAIDRLVAAVSTIELSAPADARRDASKPTATITIERKPGAPAPAAGSAAPLASPAPAGPIVIDVIADGASDWVHDRSSPRAIVVDKARLDAVLTAGRATLVKRPPPPAPAGAGSAAPPGLGALPPGALPPGMLPPGMDPSGAP